MEHVHPGSAVGSISRGAEQEVLLDGDIADERQDEQRHAEYDEPQRAHKPYHPAPMEEAGPPAQRIRNRPGRGESEHPGAPHQRHGDGGDAERTRRA